MEWDERLTTYGVFTELKPAGNWQVTSVRYQDEQEAQGQHHIWFTVLDAAGQPRPNVKCFMDWAGRDLEDSPTAVTTGADGKANTPMYANLDLTKKNGPYFAYVEDQAHCDLVKGMGLPEHHHVNFLITFQPRGIAPQQPTQTVEQTIMDQARSVSWMPVNNQGALWKFAKARGLQDQQSTELGVIFNGQEYVLQVFNLGIVYAKKGDWGNIKVIPK